MKKVFVTRKMDEEIFAKLTDGGFQVDINDEGLSDCEELKKVVKEYDAVITTVGCKMDQEVLDEAGDQLKIVATASVGYDHIDIEKCKEKNIFATNTPGANAWCVAEHTVGLILNLTHRISESDRFVRKGEFHGFKFDLFLGDEIKDNTIGIVGLGHIGKDVFKILHDGFGCKVYYYDCARDVEFEKNNEITFVESLEGLMSKVDILTLHVPLNKNTKYLINESNLKLMKPNAYIINTARGAVINEKDLVSALHNKQIKAAALDVFEDEPIITKDLFLMENVVLTPHIAASSNEAHKAMIDMAIDNVEMVLNGNEPRNAI